VLVAQVAGKSNAMTVLGSQIFFWARLAYAIIYTVGVPSYPLSLKSAESNNRVLAIYERPRYLVPLEELKHHSIRHD
jgi:hypothetical protein